jgi:hypothetical protein
MRIGYSAGFIEKIGRLGLWMEDKVACEVKDYDRRANIRK